LTRATAVLGTLFLLGALFLGIARHGGGRSVVGDVEAPPPAAAAPALPNAPAVTPTPTTPPPATPAASPTPTGSPTPTATPAGRGRGGN
jgi:hypothetical protein